jgi:hypothetical protein
MGTFSTFVKRNTGENNFQENTSGVLGEAF